LQPFIDYFLLSLQGKPTEPLATLKNNAWNIQGAKHGLSQYLKSTHDTKDQVNDYTKNYQQYQHQHETILENETKVIEELKNRVVEPPQIQALYQASKIKQEDINDLNEKKNFIFLHKLQWKYVAIVMKMSKKQLFHK